MSRPSPRFHLVRSTKPDSTGYRIEKSNSPDRLVEQGVEVLLGAADVVGIAVEDLQDVGPALVALGQAELEAGEGHRQRVVGPLVAVGLAEAPVALVEEPRCGPHAVGALSPNDTPPWWCT